MIFIKSSDEHRPLWSTLHRHVMRLNTVKFGPAVNNIGEFITPQGHLFIGFQTCHTVIQYLLETGAQEKKERHTEYIAGYIQERMEKDVGAGQPGALPGNYKPLCAEASQQLTVYHFHCRIFPGRTDIYTLKDKNLG